MSDEFLYRLREMPRPEFAEALKERVFRERPRSPTARRVRTGLVVLLAALIIAACAAPPIRKPLVQATEEIIGSYMRTSRPLQVETFSCTEDFQKSLPFPVHLPTWIPEGLQCRDINYIHNPWGGMVMIEWRALDGSSPLILIVHDTPKVIYMADEKEPVLLNGKPATLLRKRGEENALAMLMVQWVDEENGTTYCLQEPEGQISQDVLLKIAASVR